MVLRVLSILGALVLVVCFVRAVQAHQEPVHRQLPNFDRRPDAPTTPPAAASVKAKAREAYLSNRTRRLERGGRVLPLRHFYSTGRYVHRPEGMRRGRLPAPGGQAGRVNRPPTAVARESVESFLEEQRELLGFGAEALESARLLRDHRSPNNGVRTLVWQQVIQDLDVYEGVVIGHVSDEGDLISLSAQFLSEFEPAPAAPGWDAARAIQRAAQAIEEPEVLLETIRPLDPAASVESGSRFRFAAPPLPGEVWVRLVWLPMNESQARLCWEVELVRRLGGELYRVLVDAHNGDIMIRHRRTYYLSEATYRVFPSDSPRPLSPGHPEPSTNQPPRVARSLVTLSALSTNASPTGWIHDADNETRGNNVEAALDRNADNLPDLPRPTGSPARVFDFPMDLDEPPGTYGEASAVQLFYWANWMHDRLYELGFTEAAGNLQKDNFGRGGVGGDPLIADAQDGSGFNNANYSPRPDGVSPRIQMFLFDGPEPDRDGSLDADIVLHEYTHGLSDRLVGGGIGITALQTLGMGEGWSDFYAIALLSEPGDDPEGNYVEGGYATYQFQGLTENYYYGIRRYPYTTDMSRNPLTFKDIDPEQIGAYPEVPRSPNHPFDRSRASSVHRQGEVWCVTLWEARANLIAKHGFETGNELILRLVTDGMKLAPPNPTFLQARDAVLLADRVSYGGENQVELWAAFAKRGMGVNAVAPPNATTTGVVESFAVPDALTARPTATQYFSGPVGGPFNTPCRLIEIHNPSDQPVPWAAIHGQSWLELSSIEGVVAPGQTVELFACLKAAAAILPAGRFTDVITISNRTSGEALARFMQLQILEPARMPFQEDFETGTLRSFWTTQGSPLSRTQVALQEEARDGDYHLIMDGVETALPVNSEATLMVDLAGYTNVTLTFWARQYNDEPDSPETPSYIDEASFDGVALSADGLVWHEILGLRDLENYFTRREIDLDRAAAELGLKYNDRFRLRFHHRGNDQIPRDGLAFDDLSIAGIAPRRFQVVLPADVREEEESRILEGRVRLPVPAERDILVTLTSSDPTEARVPDTVLLAAGAVEVVFALTLVDDLELDGPQEVTVSASAPGYLGDAAIMRVLDNETARLILAVPPRVREGQGTLALAGLVLVDRAPHSDIPILLSSPDTSEILVPAAIVLAAGETMVPFDIQVVDDGEIDGDQELIVSVSVDQWTGDQDVIVVEDNEHRNLGLTLPPLLNEADAVLPNGGRVSISGTLPFDLSVTLKSSQPEKISIPESVTIAAGSTRADFTLTTFNDQTVAGASSIRLTAVAEAFADGTAFLHMLDNEEPPRPFAPGPVHASTNVSPTVDLSWKTGVPELLVNGGFESGSLAGWFSSVSLNGSFVVNDGMVDPTGPETETPPYRGTFSAVSQQIGPGRQELFQDIQIPAFVDDVTLSWVQRIRNHADVFATNQSFRVEIRNAANQLLGLAFATQPGDPRLGDWEEKTFRLTPWRGQRVRLAFVEQDELGFMNVHLDDVEVYLSYADPTLSEVYFGTNPVPGPAEFRGITTNTVWDLSLLDSRRDYYWQIVARRGQLRQPGPVWTFQTGGVGPVDHFTWEPAAPAPEIFVPFPVTLTARDLLGQVVSNYHGAAHLSALRETALTPVQVLVFSKYSDALRQSRRTMGGIAVHFTNFVHAFTTETSPAVLLEELEGKNVLFIMDQPFVPKGAMEQLGREWAAVLDAFVRSGGVVVALSYQKDEHELLNASGLLPIVKAGTTQALRVVTADASELTTRLPEAFDAFRVATYEAPTNGTVLLTGTSNEVVAASRRLGDGMAALIGSDYATNRTDMDRLLANVIAWPQRDTLVEVAMQPAQSGFFVDGRWSGAVTVREAGQNIVLRAENSAGKEGVTRPFQVGATNDLALTAHDAPDPLRVGERLVVSLEVANSGPGSLSGVILSNQLPAHLAFELVEPGQGACVHTNGLVLCDLGDLAGGQVVPLKLSLRPLRSGELTNIVRVTSASPEAFLGNNTATTVTRVNPPSLSIAPISVTEGNGDATVAVFTIDLAPANPLEIRCQVVTADGSAEAGKDYRPLQETLVFPPGATRRTVTVPIVADTLHEDTELFVLRLSQAVNASILTPQVGCTLLDDDAPPEVTWTDAGVLEGGLFEQTNAVFTVNLSGPSGRDVVLTYATADGTARAGEDYTAVNGTLLIPAGNTSAPLLVTILGDDTAESNETFLVRFPNVQGAVAGAAQEATGLIVDDDAARLDHFTWSAIPSPQFLGEPFPATLTARDSLGEVFTGPLASVALSGFARQRVLEVGVAAGSWEFPVGTTFHDLRLQSIYPNRELDGPSRITGMALNVTSIPGLRLNEWTIRMKHTPDELYAAPAWEGDGWTVVYRRDQAVPFTGWKWFEFETPFEFNGTDHLLVDWSFNNDGYAPGGFCAFVETEHPRSLAFATDSGFGPPAAWRGSTTPPPQVFRRVPAAQFRIEEPISIEPNTASNWVDGTWSGLITAQETSPQMSLRAKSRTGPTGEADAFSVAALDDLGLSVTVTPDPVSYDGLVTYSLLVTNTGPGSSSGVTLTNDLPPNLVFQSVSVSRGDCVFQDGRVRCLIGAMESQTDALITITAVSRSFGLITNRAAVARSEPESHLANNAVSLITRAQPPSISIADVVVMEQDSGTNDAVFTVSLSNPTESAVSVAFATAGLTATNAHDFTDRSGVLVFEPFATNRLISIGVTGDLRYESNETFTVNLANPTNAILGRATGVATIVDNDSPPSVTLEDVALTEGDAGQTTFFHEVKLSQPSGKLVWVDYATSNGTATATQDYLPASGRLFFPPGLAVRSIFNRIHGDQEIEPDEFYTVHLFDPVECALGRSNAVITLVNDDGLPGVLDHFAWQPVGATQWVGAPFFAQLEARDFYGEVATNFFGFADVRGREGPDDIRVEAGGTTWNLPFGSGSHDARSQLIYLANDLGGPSVMRGLALHVLLPPPQILRDFTIRLKHTSLSRHVLRNWEDGPWTTVYRADEDIDGPGWRPFLFEEPFVYNGQDNLLVDLSFNNSYFTLDGFVEAGSVGSGRTLYQQVDSEHGDPRQWTGSASPVPATGSVLPAMRFILGRDIPVAPEHPLELVAGRWSGPLAVLQTSPSLSLRAHTAPDITGGSNPFSVIAAADTDHDGLPDEWEVRHFGSVDHPDAVAAADPDGDGASNEEEFLAGTNPTDPQSVLVLTGISVDASGVTVTFATVAGNYYLVYFTTNLTAPQWTALGDPVAGTGGTMAVRDGPGPISGPRFYRVLSYR